MRKDAVGRVWFLAFGLVAACSSETVRGLDERQAYEALAALGRAGIPAERPTDGEGWRITVPRGEAARAAAVLAAQGIPRPRKAGLSQRFGDEGLLPSAAGERARWLDALGGELSAHLARLPGVADASVVVAARPPDSAALVEPAQPAPATASVLLLVARDALRPTPDDVKRLVAAGVEGLQPEDVAVVIADAPGPPAAVPAFAAVGPLLVARSSRSAVLGVLGGACAAVAVLAAWVIIRERRLARLLRKERGAA